MNCNVVRFPGSNCDEDVFNVFKNVLNLNTEYVWHIETQLKNPHLVVLPGGFSHGDYLRAGAMAKISPIVPAIQAFAKSGGLVLGICNGFQILTEIGLLPGALLKNKNQQFICDWVNLKVENTKTPFTSLYKENAVIRMPIAHGEGRYYIDEAGLQSLKKGNQILFRYCNAVGKLTEESNVNGSVDSIAGICNPSGNVLGIMPHPERCSEALLGGTDGLLLFESIQKSLQTA